MTAVPSMLAPYVEGAWAYEVDLGPPGVPGVHRGLPSTALTVVLALDEPLDCGWTADAGSRAERWATASGLHTRSAAIHHRGRQRGVQLSLTTSGARALLGVPAQALRGEIVELEAVAPGLSDLPERVAGLEPGAALRVVLGRLTAALASHGAARPRSEVGRALARLSRGEAVQDVAAEVGYSRRRLSTLVREESGLTPKQFQRVARFQTSRGLVGHRPLAEVATACGYADQSHLTRDWSELAGCSPGAWLREEFPFLQDRAVDDPAP